MSILVKTEQSENAQLFHSKRKKRTSKTNKWRIEEESAIWGLRSLGCFCFFFSLYFTERHLLFIVVVTEVHWTFAFRQTLGKK